MVVSGHKNRDRHFVGTDLAEHLESVHLRHLDVKENEIRLPLPNHSDSGFPVAAFADYLHAGMLAQQAPYRVAGQWLVIDKQRQDVHRDGPSTKTGADRNGMESSAQTPV